MIYYLQDEKGEPIGLEYNDTTYLYKKNYQGDIIGIYDSNYTLIVNYNYDSWGNILSITDNNNNEITDPTNIGIINPYRYRSYYYDRETKLYYLNSRYYNPVWGRFINEDILISQSTTNSLGMNMYAYCLNNYVNFDDKTGKMISSSIKLWSSTKKVVNVILNSLNNCTNAIIGSANTVNLNTQKTPNINIGLFTYSQSTSINKTTGTSNAIINFTSETDLDGSTTNVGIKFNKMLEFKFGLDNIGFYINSISINNMSINSGTRLNLKELKLGADINITYENEYLNNTYNMNFSMNGLGIITLIIFKISPYIKGTYPTTNPIPSPTF